MEAGPSHARQQTLGGDDGNPSATDVSGPSDATALAGPAVLPAYAVVAAVSAAALTHNCSDAETFRVAAFANIWK